MSIYPIDGVDKVGVAPVTIFSNSVLSSGLEIRLGRLSNAGNGHSHLPQHDVLDNSPYNPEIADYIRLMRHRSRVGFTEEDAMFSRPGKRSTTPSSEVYDRQMRIAGQIAVAINSATSQNDANYERVSKLLSALESDVKHHGYQLFHDSRMAKHFIGAVSVALVNAEYARVVKTEQNGNTIYRLEPRGN